MRSSRRMYGDRIDARGACCDPQAGNFLELKLLDRILRNMDKDGDPSPDELLSIRMGGMRILLVAFVLFLQKIF